MSIATRMVRAPWGPKYTPNSNTVLWMPGQDDPQSATIRDRSGNGFNGTIVGCSWQRTVNGLWYLNFDGTDDVITTDDHALFDVGANLTLKLWWRTDTAQSTRAFAIHDESNYKYMLFLEVNSTRLRGYTRHASGVVELTYTLGAGDYTDSVWRMLILTFDKSLGSDRAKLYLDDTQIAQGNAFAEDIVAGDEGLVLGRYGANDFTGDIALLVVESKTWSSSEVTYWYNQERHLFGV